MNPPAQDIAKLLSDDAGLGLTLGTDLFVGRIPPSPDSCVTVFDNAGSEPILFSKKVTNNYYRPSVSVWSRAVDYSSAYSRLFEIMGILHGTNHITINNTFYTLIRAMNDIQVLHWDENDRVVMLINFEIQRRNN